MTSRDWELWTWWATARAVPVVPARWEDLHQFLTQVPCAPSTATRRISAIRAAHHRERARITGEPVPAPAPRPGPPLGQVLQQIPVFGHPHGVRGRRDALIVLAASLGYTTTSIQALVPADVATLPGPAIGGTVLGYDAGHGLGCPACALTRWLRAVSAWRAELWEPQWRALELLVEDQPVDPRGHDCTLLVDDGWHHCPTLIPPIDRDGRPDLRYPLTTRAISAILREHRHHANASPGTPATPCPAARSDGGPGPAPPVSTPGQRREQLHAIDDALDRLDALLATLESAQTVL